MSKCNQRDLKEPPELCSQTPDGEARHQAKASGRSKKEARNASAKVGRGTEGGGVGNRDRLKKGFSKGWKMV